MNNPFFKDSDQDYHEVIQNEPQVPKHYISIDKANRLLMERGLKVSGFIEQEYGSHSFGNGQYWSGSASIRALLINVEPIAQPDTAEKLLNDILDYTPGIGSAFIERAKKLLEKK